MNPFLRYLADKHSAHRHTDRHTPMTTRPCGLRRAGKKQNKINLLELILNTCIIIYTILIVVCK